MNELDFNKAIASNILELGSFKMEAFDDRILVIEDEFRSGYECETCGGKQLVVCDKCGGSGKSYLNSLARCSKCEGKRAIECPTCSGKGVRQGGIIVPKVSERRPTTGRIVSIGHSVKNLTRGISVIFPSHIGHVYDVQAWDENNQEITVVVRVMRETEVLAKISGHLDLRRVRRESVNVTD